MEKPAVAEKRFDLRFNKVFSVGVASELFGEMSAVARNISAGGMCVEMDDPLPLGSVVTVHFLVPDGDGEVVARAEVKHHYCFNYQVGDEPARARGIGLRFLEFLENSEERLHRSVPSSRTLH